MASHEDLQNRFTFHPVRDERKAAKYGDIRATAHRFALLVNEAPECRETSLALTAIEEAVMWANAAIARHDDNGERL